MNGWSPVQVESPLTHEVEQAAKPVCAVSQRLRFLEVPAGTADCNWQVLQTAVWLVISDSGKEERQTAKPIAKGFSKSLGSQTRGQRPFQRNEESEAQQEIYLLNTLPGSAYLISSQILFLRQCSKERGSLWEEFIPAAELRVSGKWRLPWPNADIPCFRYITTTCIFFSTTHLSQDLIYQLTFIL